MICNSERYSNNKGQALIEYVFLVALAVIVVVLALSTFGSELFDMYQNIINAF